MPSQVFGATNYGLQLSLVGEAYDQSLWHAIALGALASQEIPFGKVALIVSPVWFVDGGLDADTFNARFSYALYSEFCQNPQIPDPVKSYVRDRLEAQGVDEAHLYAAESTLPHDMVNNAVFSAIDDIHLRQDLASIRSRGISLVSDDPLEQPDFVSLREQALVDASKHVSTNDWGLEDAFYTRQLAPVLGSIENYRADETYSQTPEYDDLACFLDVAQSCGLQVMVIISPVHGDYYDYIGISQDTRVSCYEHIKTVCEEHGATVADFSSREYEKYFLYDIVHFGWTGWVDIEEALWNFAKEV